METKKILVLAVVLFALFFASVGRAVDITATGSGNWSSTIPDAPWPGGVVPGTNDDADVEAPFTVTVDTNVAVQYIYGTGTVIMGTNTTLEILDPAGAYGTYQLGTLNASAPGNTVIYSGNPFWAKHQDYNNLVFSNTVVTNQISFWNGNVNTQDPAAAMTIAGNMTVIGKITVQEGAAFAIHGNLFLGTNSIWDCSSFNLTVASNTTINGLMIDYDGAGGADTFGSVTINSNGTWNLLDSTNYFVNGNLTNNSGKLTGTAYASINFNGTGVLTGSPITLPTLTFNGTNTIATTVTLTTNTPSLNGTLVFDLGHPGELIVLPSLGQQLYYNGNLDIINTGAAPMSGNTYQLFSATGYNDPYTFANITWPSLAPGLSWVDNLTTLGSISVTGTVTGAPVITAYQYNPVTHQFTLVWTSVMGAMYTVQEKPTLNTPSWTTLQSNIPSGGNTTTNTVTVPSGTTGFLQVFQQ